MGVCSERACCACVSLLLDGVAIVWSSLTTPHQQRARLRLPCALCHVCCVRWLPQHPSGQKRSHIRAYQFAYSRIEDHPHDPHSHVARGIVASDLRGEIPTAAFNTLFAVGANMAAENMRKAYARQAQADGLPKPPKCR
jgi:hypothetical protein